MAELTKETNQNGEYLKLRFSQEDLTLIFLLLAANRANNINMALYKKDYEELKIGEKREIFSAEQLGVNLDKADVKVRRFLEFVEDLRDDKWEEYKMATKENHAQVERIYNETKENDRRLKEWERIVLAIQALIYSNKHPEIIIRELKSIVKPPSNSSKKYGPDEI